nr:hypothetical protein [Tanacetum cinerariifolium]
PKPHLIRPFLRESALHERSKTSGNFSSPPRRQSRSQNGAVLQFAVRTADRGDPVGASHGRQREQGDGQAVPGRQHPPGDL